MINETQQTQLLGISTRKLKSSVYLLGVDVEADGLLAMFEEHGLRCFYIDGRDLKDGKSFLRSAPHQMGLLDECRQNFEKFGFCLQALGAYPGEGYVILYDDYDRLLEGDKQQFGDVLLELRKAARYWAQREKPLYVLLRSQDTLANVDGLRRFAPSSLIWIVGMSVVLFGTLLLLFFIVSQLGYWITTLRAGAG